METGDSPARRASDEFVAELARRRVERGLSKKQLAAQMGFDPSYVSHVEARRHRPTEDFARRAEQVLQAGGVLWRQFREYDELRSAERGRAGSLVRSDAPVPEQWAPAGTGLVVERETAQLVYVDGEYICTVSRALYNAGTEPVTRYLIRIALDRYPDRSDLSNRYYHEHPLGWPELALAASADGEPMRWRPKSDREAFKEVWLLFENAQGRFPLYPGQRSRIEYSWRAPAEKWGRWFQRAMRLPTRQLTVRLDFPVAFGPVVWGVETSLAAEAVPLRTPIEQEVDRDRAVFTWTTDSPPLHSRFRLEWRFRAEPGQPGQAVGTGSVQPGQAGTGSVQPGQAGTGSVQPGQAGTGSVQQGQAGTGSAPRLPSPRRPQDLPGSPRPEAPPQPGMPAGTAVPPWPEVPPPRAHSPRQPAASPGADQCQRGRPSAEMRAAGVVQRGADVLRRPGRHFDLPREQGLAAEAVAELLAALDRIERLHPFVKGVGLAAPQLGLGYCVAVVRPAGGAGASVVLLNPLVVAACRDSDDRYEGCLSFFDVRGLVSRPLWIDVETSALDGSRTVTRFERGTARLVAHEIDHLYGKLYVDRMAPRAALVPVEEYQATGQPWTY